MTAAQSEELRRAIRTWLAERAALPFNAPSIHRGVAREVSCTLPEVESALLFLKDLHHIKTVDNEISAVDYYQITSAGTLAYERAL